MAQKIVWAPGVVRDVEKFLRDIGKAEKKDVLVQYPGTRFVPGPSAPASAPVDEKEEPSFLSRWLGQKGESNASQSEIDRLRRENEQLRTQLNRLNETMVDPRDAGLLQRDIADKDNQIKRLNRRIQELERELKTHIDAQRKLASKKGSTYGSLLGKAAEISQNAEESIPASLSTATLLGDIATRDTTIEELQRELDRRDRVITDLRNQHNEAVSVFRAQIKEREDRAKELQTELRNALVQIAEHEGHASQARQEQQPVVFDVSDRLKNASRTAPESTVCAIGGFPNKFPLKDARSINGYVYRLKPAYETTNRFISSSPDQELHKPENTYARFLDSINGSKFYRVTQPTGERKYMICPEDEETDELLMELYESAIKNKKWASFHRAMWMTILEKLGEVHINTTRALYDFSFKEAAPVISAKINRGPVGEDEIPEGIFLPAVELGNGEKNL